MELNEYQNKAKTTAIYPHQGNNLIYTVMGLAGEAGELANKTKKLMRSYGLEPGTSIDELINNPKSRKILEGLYGELGGILWYVSQVATELHTTLDIIGEANLDELSNRVKSNSIEGDGDNRGNME